MKINTLIGLLFCDYQKQNLADWLQDVNQNVSKCKTEKS